MAKTAKKTKSPKKPVAKKTTASKKTAATKAAAKKPVKKTTPKKSPAKKAVAKKAVKKVSAKTTKKPAVKSVKKSPAKKVAKTATKKAVKKSPKKTATKKPVAKKTPAKKISPKTTSVKKKTISKAAPKKAATKTTKPTAKSAKPKAAKATAVPKKEAKATKKPALNKEEHIKKVIKKLAGANKNTPTAFKLPSRKNTPVIFSMNEMQDLLKDVAKKSDDLVTSSSQPKKAKIDDVEVVHKPRSVKSATLDDLLGLGGTKPVKRRDKNDVPRKWIGYYNALMEMRDRLTLSVEERSVETKASAKDSAGDLSSYGQHIGDAGTAAYDYDFALSMVSSEQDMLKEVDAALDRIFNGTYGICEVTGAPIQRERLQVVPFTRFSKEGQDQFEKTKRKTVQRIGIASDDNDDAFASFGDENDE